MQLDFAEELVRCHLVAAAEELLELTTHSAPRPTPDPSAISDPDAGPSTSLSTAGAPANLQGRPWGCEADMGIGACCMST